MTTIAAITDGRMQRPAGFDDEAAWRHVLARDSSCLGSFVYAVQSTGIYCRPGCPSRHPSRRNVRFFATCGEAEAAGFRACLRCKPARGQDGTDCVSHAIGQAAEMLRTSHRESLSIDGLARAVGLSRFALLRGFRRILGVTPREFAQAHRRERFREKVRRNSGSVTDALYAAGFSSSSRLYQDSAGAFGMRPSAMRARGAGETIRWSTAESELGRVLVAATEHGICAVLFADSDEQAEAELTSRFAQATRHRDDTGLGEGVRFVLSHLTESPAAASLPFDVRATSFQHRVWEALRRIPRGETRTYGEIAAAIGAPKAVRAVGTACGANPLAVIVPCHRAIGADGRITGYRWGLERKTQLLAMEKALPGENQKR